MWCVGENLFPDNRRTQSKTSRRSFFFFLTKFVAQLKVFTVIRCWRPILPVKPLTGLDGLQGPSPHTCDPLHLAGAPSVACRRSKPYRLSRHRAAIHGGAMEEQVGNTEAMWAPRWAQSRRYSLGPLNTVRSDTQP